MPETEMVVLSWALRVDAAARRSRLVVVKRAIFAVVWGDDPGDVWMWREAKKDVDRDGELRRGMADIDRDTYVCMDVLDIDERKENETRGWDTPTYPLPPPFTNQETEQHRNMASPPLGRHREEKSPFPGWR